MRGKVGYEIVCFIIVGITPAHAGKRLSGYRKKTVEEDHPRACGEKRSLKAPAGTNVGSPPRMRGKALDEISLHLFHRITPAHAGKSYTDKYK